MTEIRSLLTLAGEAARHAATRQTVIARNIANADTPGFAAQDVVPFGRIMSGTSPDFMPHMTRSGHMGAVPAMDGLLIEAISTPGAQTPDGNTVSIEDQMVRAADARRQHDLALSLYRKSIDIIRLGLGRAR